MAEDPERSDPEILWLASVRSHDQYNTTVYSLSDRYRGVYGQRDVLFLGREEMERRGLAPDERVDLLSASSGSEERVLRNFRLVPCDFPRGCCAAYYPEVNPLVALRDRDPVSLTPAYKGIAIRIRRTRPDAGSA